MYWPFTLTVKCIFLFFDSSVTNEDKRTRQGYKTKQKELAFKLIEEVSEKIKDIISTHIRPAVAQDGGDIVFENFKDGIVYVSMKGSCDGCPSSTMTLKNGVENLLKHYIPEVQGVSI